MQKLACLFLFIFCSWSPALTVAPADIQKQLDNAELVAEITVNSWESFADPINYAGHRVNASIDRIISAPTTIANAGDNITIEGLGGELDGVGVVVPGYPRPLVNHRYKVYLNRTPNGVFTITGFESGLIDLDPSSHLYTRNRTDGSNGDGTGPFLFWDSTFFPIPYYIAQSTFAGHPDFIKAIDQSFRTWRNIQDITIEFIPMGCTTKTVDENDGINAVMLITKNWQFDTAVIALTRNFYVAGDSPKPGLILTTDIMLNGQSHQFTTTGDPNSFDVQDIVTHEAGHFQGLGHDTVPPIDPDATMYATALPGETKKRTLHQDDLDGIHAAYHGVGKKLSAFAFPSCEIADSNVGCAAVHNSRRDAKDLFWCLLFLGSLLIAGRIAYRFNF